MRLNQQSLWEFYSVVKNPTICSTITTNVPVEAEYVIFCGGIAGLLLCFTTFRGLQYLRRCSRNLQALDWWPQRSNSRAMIDPHEFGRKLAIPNDIPSAFEQPRHQDTARSASWRSFWYEWISLYCALKAGVYAWEMHGAIGWIWESLQAAGIL